ncbi:50S ribosomal protein L11 [Candidatus Woesearchaeota archaeon]|nr:50S ribosomal protein L11 [Candidatus Woesearchaeota archaeon]
MAKQTVDALVPGGKATAAPPLGPALGPLGVNIGQVIVEINKKTSSFKGMQVPVKVTVDTDTKEFTVSVGTPPASALIKQEAGLEKGSSNPLAEKVADIKIEQAIKVSKMKQDSLLGKTTKERVKEIIGTCQSMGILVEGKPAHEIIVAIDNGAFAQEIATEKTEISAEELKALEVEKKRMQEEITKRRAEFESLAKGMLKELGEAATNSQKRNKLAEAKIPQLIIDQLVPPEKAAPAAGGAGKK